MIYKAHKFDKFYYIFLILKWPFILTLILETDEDCIDEGIEEGDKRWDDETEEERNNTKELEHIIEVNQKIQL